MAEEEWQIIVRRIREQDKAQQAAEAARAAAALELAEAYAAWQGATYYSFNEADDRLRVAYTAYRLVRDV